jgi:hypothetical protein
LIIAILMMVKPGEWFFQRRKLDQNAAQFTASELRIILTGMFMVTGAGGL